MVEHRGDALRSDDQLASELVVEPRGDGSGEVAGGDEGADVAIEGAGATITGLVNVNFLIFKVSVVCIAWIVPKEARDMSGLEVDFLKEVEELSDLDSVFAVSLSRGIWGDSERPSQEVREVMCETDCVGVEFEDFVSEAEELN